LATKARDIMTAGAECVNEDETLLDAARKLRALDVGALPICGNDDRLKGMLTDRDIVVKVLAEGKDPGSTKAGELGQGKPVTIGADDGLDELVRTMAQHEVKRLPVIDGHRLIGMVSEADLAEHASPEQVVSVVRGVYAD
jgi:CBS domain-containing protein